MTVSVTEAPVKPVELTEILLEASAKLAGLSTALAWNVALVAPARMVMLAGTVTAFVLALVMLTDKSATLACGMETVPVADAPSFTGLGVSARLKKGVRTDPLPETLTMGELVLATERAVPESVPAAAVAATRRYTGVLVRTPPLWLSETEELKDTLSAETSYPDDALTETEAVRLVPETVTVWAVETEPA